MDKLLAYVDGEAKYIRITDGKLEILPDDPPECCRGVLYANRDEIMAHIEKGVEPKSLELPRLKERLATAEAGMQAARAQAEEAETRAKAAEVQAQAAKRKTEALEVELAAVKDDVADMRASKEKEPPEK